MNAFSKVLVAGVVSVVAAGSAFAGEASDYRQEHNLTPNIGASYGYGQNVGSVAQLAGGNDVTIRTAAEALGQDEARNNVIPGSSDVQSLRSEARQSQAVVSELAARGLSVSDIAGGYTALNGDVVYIVR